ncbi:hypothetical protein [Bacillus cereus]|uniref:Phage protein n=1 Tax=Bacillus cereus VD184 TaxID=1053242 RepID=A0A9W5R0A7_BACCE|nr:hypothetical protein [Bacillus cereus]EOQ00421.1 hypothetical protein IKC_06466 [Bacillus cereus VD184]
MENKRLQMKINSIKEPTVYRFVKQLEKEGCNEKGYENKKILDILNAWIHLTDIYKETDTMKLAMLLARGGQAPQIDRTVNESETVEKEIVEEVKGIEKEQVDPNEQDYLAMLAGVKQKARQKRENQN